MAWDILSALPKGDLTRVSLDEIKARITSDK
jgi:hypothetical protein